VVVSPYLMPQPTSQALRTCNLTITNPDYQSVVPAVTACTFCAQPPQGHWNWLITGHSLGVIREWYNVLVCEGVIPQSDTAKRSQSRSQLLSMGFPVAKGATVALGDAGRERQLAGSGSRASNW